jgi:hypothetical protein
VAAGRTGVGTITASSEQVIGVQPTSPRFGGGRQHFTQHLDIRCPLTPRRHRRRLTHEEGGRRVEMSKMSKKVRRADIRVEEVILPGPPDLLPGVSGRVLVGWMPATQSNNFIGAFAADDEEILRLRRAGEMRVAAVKSLDRVLDQSGVIEEIPAKLAFHVSQFVESAIGKAAKAEGFNLAYVDLTKLVAFQSFVRQASVRNYSLMVAPNDITSAARIALPVDFRSEIRARYDPHSGSWHVFSLDQNLRIVGQLGHPNPDGSIGVGYNFAVQPSLVKVQTYKGRSYLSDGYHRTVALLRRGFTESLALVRDVAEFEQLGALGHLPLDSFTGESPPLLRDYSDDRLSLELKVPGGARHFLLRPQQLS